MLAVDLVLKALSRSKSFSLIFIFNFTLAIASLSYLQFFKSSIDASLDVKAKSLLGADLSVSSRFPISDEQIEAIKENLPKVKNFHQGISTVSMVASNKRARLMELVEQSEGFPYYGGLQFRDTTQYPQGDALLQDHEAWVYREVLELLDLKLGDSIKIGKAHFVIAKVIVDDTLKTVSFSGFMPKIYLSKEAFKKTELLRFGATVRYKLHYQFVKKFTNDRLEAIENTLKEKIDKNLRVLSPNDGRDRLLGVLKFITDFLSLVSLVSLFLGLVGLIYLYSGFLQKHKKDITVLNDLGISKRSITLTYILHLFTLILVSSLMIAALIMASVHFAEPLLQKSIGFEFEFQNNYDFFMNAFILLVLLSLSVGIPLILPLIQRIKYSFLSTFLTFFPFIILLLSVSHFVAPTKNIGFLFASGLLAFIALFFAIGSWILRRMDFSGHFESLSLSLALKNITRERKTSLTLFGAILLCTTFFSLIPQVGASLSNTLALSVEERPRFFVIDAKEEEISTLQNEVQALGAELENISPMIRARVIKINDVDFKTHAMNQNDDTSQNDRNALSNSTVNLSYRDHLRASEQIIQGGVFSGVYDSKDFSKLIELSVEQRYAKRRGIVLGDHITFDVLGLEIKTVVVNIRTVNWAEFVPNFFFILQKGAIDDAPKTVLATISRGEYNASQMLLKLTHLFPSLTLIDVKNLFETFAELVDKITLITDKMSYYSIAVGLIMSFIIIQYQMNVQKNNILRLKMIGVTNKTIRNSFLIEFGLIAFTASSLGIILGSVSSFMISGLQIGRAHV